MNLRMEWRGLAFGLAFASGILTGIPGASQAAAAEPVSAAAQIERLGFVFESAAFVRAIAARYGLNVVDVQNVIETALGGKEATEIWEGERKYPVVVRLREDQRADFDSIARIPIDTPKGMRIPLGDVATLCVRGGSMNVYAPERLAT